MQEPAQIFVPYKKLLSCLHLIREREPQHTIRLEAKSANEPRSIKQIIDDPKFLMDAQ